MPGVLARPREYLCDWTFARICQSCRSPSAALSFLQRQGENAHLLFGASATKASPSAIGRRPVPPLPPAEGYCFPPPLRRHSRRMTCFVSRLWSVGMGPKTGDRINAACSHQSCRVARPRQNPHAHALPLSLLAARLHVCVTWCSHICMRLVCIRRHERHER